MNPIIEINNLIEFHGGKYDRCPGCQHCKRIEELKRLIDRTPEEEYAHILEKGQDMNIHDILFLVEKNVELVSIRKALGLGIRAFETLCKRWEIKSSERGGSREEKFVTEEQYLELKAQGLKDKEIAFKLDLHPCTLTLKKRKWKQAKQEKAVL